MIDIERMTPGSPPSGFTFARTGRGGVGQWTVVEDPTALAGRAIEQSSTDRTDYRFPLAIHDSLSAANVNVELRFKAVGGKIDQAAGVAVRLQDADNYYVARANALEDNVRFYRVVNGRREQLGGANLRVTANEWHTLGLRAEGERLTVSYDGKTLFGATDKTFTEAGGVALWTKADSITRFDQVKITPLPQRAD
jgi:Galactocerebrosidase, C-terminal lectin domain